MCDWPIYEVYGVNAVRTCFKWGTYDVGPLNVCPQHYEILRNGVMDVARAHKSEAEVIRHSLRRIEIGHAAAAREAQEALYAAQGRPSVIYFAEREGFVKIGKTVNLAIRMRDLSRGSSMVAGMTVGPVTLLATVPGSLREEWYFHRRFRTLRVDPRREWFRYEGALRKYVEELAATAQP